MEALARTRCVTTLNLSGATVAMEAGHRHAEQLAVNVAITVTDCAGEPLTCLRMDGAPAISVTLSAAKARTAAQMKTSTGLLQSLVDEGHASYLASNLCMLEGGMPVWVGTEVVGAVGVSGADEEVDHAVAVVASQAIEMMLSKDVELRGHG